MPYALLNSSVLRWLQKQDDDDDDEVTVPYSQTCSPSLWLGPVVKYCSTFIK